MLRLSCLVLIVLGFYGIQPAAYAQDVEDTQALEQQQGQRQAQDRRARIEELRQLDPEERQARRAERQRQIDSLTDEQRQALRERRRLREAAGSGQRGQRPSRRRPPPPAANEGETEDPA